MKKSMFCVDHNHNHNHLGKANNLKWLYFLVIMEYISICKVKISANMKIWIKKPTEPFTQKPRAVTMKIQGPYHGK